MEYFTILYGWVNMSVCHAGKCRTLLISLTFPSFSLMFWLEWSWESNIDTNNLELLCVQCVVICSLFHFFKLLFLRLSVLWPLFGFKGTLSEETKTKTPYRSPAACAKQHVYDLAVLHKDRKQVEMTSSQGSANSPDPQKTPCNNECFYPFRKSCSACVFENIGEIIWTSQLIGVKIRLRQAADFPKKNVLPLVLFNSIRW